MFDAAPAALPETHVELALLLPVKNSSIGSTKWAVAYGVLASLATVVSSQ